MYLLSCMLNVICRAALALLSHTPSHIHTFLYSTRLVELSRVAFSPPPFPNMSHVPSPRSVPKQKVSPYPSQFVVVIGFALLSYGIYLYLPPSPTHSDISSAGITARGAEKRKEKQNKTKK